jgi:cardiolipin synthase
MTVPNLLTLTRILLTPLLVWLLLNRNLNYALAVFLIAGLTDGLDGLIARVFNQKSKLGAYLDPLADKLLLVSSFILLGRLHLAPSWLVIIAVSRDAIILLGLLMLMFHQIPVEIRPAVVSKATTLAQLITVLAALGSDLFPLPSWNYLVLFVITAALSVVSGFHYIRVGISIYEENRARSNGGGS